jgi:hypothetical protein
MKSTLSPIQHTLTGFLILFSVISLFFAGSVSAQVDMDNLALTVSKAEQANLEKLKAYIWKRQSDVYLSDVLKVTVLSECKFDSSGKIDIYPIEAKSTSKEKPGIRGRVQSNAAEDKIDYVANALELSLAYAYMTKGELLDFFGKAKVSEGTGGLMVISAENVKLKGDKLTVHIDPATHLIKYKEFSSFLDKDPIAGKLFYETFSSSGIVHGTNTTLNLPAQKTRIEAKNLDYAQRVN